MKISESERQEILDLLILLKDPSAPKPVNLCSELFGSGMLRICLGAHYEPKGDEENMREELVRLLIAKDLDVWRMFLNPLYKCLANERAIFDEFVKVSPFPDTIVIPFDSISPQKRDYDFSHLSRHLDQAIAETERGVVYFWEGAVIVTSLDSSIVGIDIMGSG